MSVTRIWTDAARHCTTGEGCSGVLVQHNGKFHRYSCKHKVTCKNSTEAERRAIIHGLEYARELGAHTVKLYSDSLNNVRAMRSKKYKLSKTHRNVVRGFRVVEYNYINRNNNHYADYLARLAWKKEEYEAL